VSGEFEMALLRVNSGNAQVDRFELLHVDR